MKKTLLLSFIFLLVLSLAQAIANDEIDEMEKTSVVFSDDTKDWLEKEFNKLDDNMKAEYKKIFDESAQNVRSARLKILSNANKLATSIEENYNAENERYKKELSSAIIEADKYKKDLYAKISRRNDSFGRNFLKFVTGQDDNERIMRSDVRLFSENAVKSIDKMLKEIKIENIEKKEFMSEYEDKLKLAGGELKKAYLEYSKMYAKGKIVSDEEFMRARNNFKNSIEKIIDTSSEAYSKVLAMLDEKDKAKFIKIRERIMERQIKKINER